jgi:hypothetical protein
VVPRDRWTIEILDKAAQIVRSNHLDEIIQQEAERLAARPAAAVVGADGSTSYSETGGDLRPLDKLFADNDPVIKRFKEAGLDAAAIRQRFVAMGTSEEEYVANLKAANIISDGKHTQSTARAYS